MTYTLKLTAEQAELLGYCLTLAKRDRTTARDTAKTGWRRDELSEQLTDIEALRQELDCCPAA